MTNVNPFHALGLPTDADNDSINKRGKELAELAESEELRQLYGQAARELLRDPLARRLHEVLEAPKAAYRDEMWEDFERQHKRNPANLDTLRDAGPLRASDIDLAAVIDRILDEWLAVPDVDVIACVRNAPVAPGVGRVPLEVADVLFG